MIKENILRKLYLKKRMSMAEISKFLGKNERQVDYWMKKYNIKTRKISDAIYLKHNKNGDPFKIPEFAKKEISFKNPLFLYGLCLGLYWGEGTKRNLHAVRLGNSDPKLINKFVNILIEIFKIDKNKLKFGLQIFSDIDTNKALDFWSNYLKTSKDNFYKPVITLSGKIGNYKNKSKWGVVTVYFNNIKLRNFMFEKVSKL